MKFSMTGQEKGDLLI